MTGNYKDKFSAVLMATLMVLSVVAIGGAALAGSATAAHNDGPDVTLNAGDISGDDTYIGQEVEVTGLSEPADLMQGGDVVQNLRVSDGSATFSTEGLDEGRYYIEYGEDESTSTFWVNEQEISASWSTSTISVGDSATLEYEDVSDIPRDSVDVYVSAEDADGNAVSAEDLSAALGDSAEVHEGVDNAVLIEGYAGEDLETDFEGWAVGDYTFTIDVADTTAESSATITVQEAADFATQFSADEYEGTAGDHAEFTVEINSGSTAAVQIFDDGQEFYTANITVEDGDNDGEVTVQLNTYEAGQGNEDGAYSAVQDPDTDGQDSVTVEDDDSLTEYDVEARLPADIYEMQVFPDTETEDEDDIAFLTLETGSVGDLNTWITSEPAGDDEIEDILGNSIQRNHVAQGDYLVFEVEASGFYGYLTTDGTDFDPNDEGLSMTFNDTEEPRFGSPDSATLETALDEGWADLHTDEENGTFYVVVDQSASNNIDVDETWDVSFSVTADNNDYYEEDAEAADSFSVEERNVELVGDTDDDDRLLVEQSDEAVIAGQTNIAPGGDSVDYRVRFADSVMRGSAEVNDDGSFSDTFDLSDRDVGEEFDIRTTLGDDQINNKAVVAEGTDEDEDNESGAAWKATATLPENAVEGDVLEFSVDLENNGDAEGTTTVQLVFDGKNVIDAEETVGVGESVTLEGTDEKATADTYNWSLVVNGTTIDEGELTVEEGDTDGDDTDGDDTDGDDTDGDDTDGDDTDGDDTDGDDTDGDDTDGDDTDGDDTDGDDTETDDTEDDDDEGDDGTPGFGVAVALVALLGAAMLALRRQD
ncbi:BGTF surface domain-containing protein [Saliphagus sp. GCM10025334]